MDEQMRELPAVVMQQIRWNEAGLVAAIAQDAETLEILMMAWMNAEALEMTLRTKRVTYYSRSRQQLWIKGETSGHVQTLQEMRIDCDGDALLLLIQQEGAACHTGNRSCFYRNLNEEGAIER